MAAKDLTGAVNGASKHADDALLSVTLTQLDRGTPIETVFCKALRLNPQNQLGCIRKSQA